ncbi:hypothetical protein RUND412_009444 [Rhizina undulata]
MNTDKGMPENPLVQRDDANTFVRGPAQIDALALEVPASWTLGKEIEETTASSLPPRQDGRLDKKDERRRTVAGDFKPFSKMEIPTADPPAESETPHPLPPIAELTDKAFSEMEIPAADPPAESETLHLSIAESNETIDTIQAHEERELSTTSEEKMEIPAADPPAESGILHPQLPIAELTETTGTLQAEFSTTSQEKMEITTADSPAESETLHPQPPIVESTETIDTVKAEFSTTSQEEFSTTSQEKMEITTAEPPAESKTLHPQSPIAELTETTGTLQEQLSTTSEEKMEITAADPPAESETLHPHPSIAELTETIETLQAHISKLERELSTTSQELQKTSALLIGERRARLAAEETRRFLEVERKVGVCCEFSRKAAKTEAEDAATVPLPGSPAASVATTEDKEMKDRPASRLDRPASRLRRPPSRLGFGEAPVRPASRLDAATRSTTATNTLAGRKRAREEPAEKKPAGRQEKRVLSADAAAGNLRLGADREEKKDENRLQKKPKAVATVGKRATGKERAAVLARGARR